MIKDEGRLSWEEFENISNKLYQDILTSAVNFDAIIGIARGGLCLSSMLSYKLNIKQLYIINTQLYKEQRLIEPSILFYPKDLHLKNVLVVDDILDTGSTYSLLKDVLEKISDNYYWAILLDKGKSTINIDFVGRTLKNDYWIEFPWNS